MCPAGPKTQKIVPARVDCIPLKPLVCFSGKTFLSLKESFKELVFVVKAPRILKLRPRAETSWESEEIPWKPGWRYEPSGMVNVWGLRLGAESGGEGWWRVWRFWRESQDISEKSYRRWWALGQGSAVP